MINSSVTWRTAYHNGLLWSPSASERQCPTFDSEENSWRHLSEATLHEKNIVIVHIAMHEQSPVIHHHSTYRNFGICMYPKEMSSPVMYLGDLLFPRLIVMRHYSLPMMETNLCNSLPRDILRLELLLRKNWKTHTCLCFSLAFSFQVLRNLSVF